MNKGARELALEVLLRVEREGSYSNLLLSSVLDESTLSTKDSRLVTEIVYGTISQKAKLDFYLSRFVTKPIHKLETWVLILLRISFYQLIFLDRIPPFAVVNEAVNIAKKRGHRGIAGFVNGVIRTFLREPNRITIPPEIEGVKRMAIEYSHPEWMIERWVKEYGKETTEKILMANNEPHPISIRVNSLKTTRGQLLECLNSYEYVEAVPSQLSPQGIRFIRGGNPASLREYVEGLYTIQDESSMLVAQMLKPLPGMRVLDACAAPGGKTTHIAELMNNRGEIIANDLHPHKENLIRKQAERLGISIIRTVIGDALTIAERMDGLFDRILLDAPCSGFGVIRRKPDLKWSKGPEDVGAIAELQYQLLESVSRLLKKGGLLIYSTCTIEPEENGDLVRRFIARNPEYKLDETFTHDLPSELLKESVQSQGMMQILPHQYGSDGFFIARLIRI